VSDIDIAVADSLKVLDLKRPIREATEIARRCDMSRWARSRLMHRSSYGCLFDHLVGAGEQRGWRIETKRFGSFRVDYQLEFGRGAVAGLVGIECGVVSGVINLESSGVEASGLETTP
jgi:hypothetical protein